MGIASDTKKLVAIIISEGKRLSLAKGEVIQSTDTSNNLCLIKSGYVKRYMILNDGNIRVQVIYGPGDIFPLALAFKILLDQDLYAGPEVYYYETMSKAEIIALDKQKLVEYVKADNHLYRDLYAEAGRRLYSNLQLLENIGLPTSYNRVAHEIAFYAKEFGEKRLTGIRIKLPFTQQDLADVLSTTRETVSLCMSELKKKKLIRTGKYLVVRDLEKLKKEAFK